MTLKEYRTSEDPNQFWRLDSGDIQNLLDEAILEIESNSTAIGELKQLLVERDGGDHDIDCKVYNGRGCNCGHDAVKKYLSRAGLFNGILIKKEY